jgi:mono/diheme cytochrome c family protein
MKRTIKLLASLSVIFTLFYCSAKVLPPTSAQLTQLKQTNPAMDTSLVVKGYDVFARSCHKCHGLKNPGKFTLDEWNKILPVMDKRAKLTQDEKDLLFTYVSTFSKKS